MQDFAKYLIKCYKISIRFKYSKKLRAFKAQAFHSVKQFAHFYTAHLMLNVYIEPMMRVVNMRIVFHLFSGRLAYPCIIAGWSSPKGFK